MTCHTYRCAAGQADDSRVTRVSSPYVPPLNEVNEVQGLNSSLVFNLLVDRNFEVGPSVHFSGDRKVETN